MERRLLKYVMTPEGPVFFPENIRHDSMKGLGPISAAFILIFGKKARVYGRSESLDLDARPEDAEIIGRLLGLDVEFVKV